MSQKKKREKRKIEIKTSFFLKRDKKVKKSGENF
jgi:hypothetical protein